MKTQSTYLSSTSLLKAAVEDIFSSRLEVSIVGLPENKAYTLWKEITKELSLLESVFDGKRSDSEVSILNASKVDIETSDLMKEALNICESYLIKTKGLFDISNGGHEILDFSDFVKGYAISRLIPILKKGKAKGYFINFGDSVLAAFGNQPYCHGWNYTLYDSNDEEISEFELNNESMAISKTKDHRLCVFKSKDPLEAEILSMVLPEATSNQRHEMSYSFNSLDELYFG